MKTLFKTFAYAAIAALALSSCAKENLKPADEITSKLVTVHFGTENTDPSTTRATLTPDAGETAFQAAWENDDEILISYSFNYPTTASTTTGKWKGTSFEAKLPAGNGDWIYDAAYPVPADDKSVDFGSSRTQKGNDFNSKYDIMIGSAVAERADAGKDDKGNDIVFEMTRQTAIAYFHFTSDLDESVISATLTVTDGAIANSAASINDFKFVAPPENDLTEINLTFEDGTAPSAKDFQLWFNVLPTTYESMTLTVETENKTFTISKNTNGEPGMYEAGKLYKVKKAGISWTDKQSITPGTHEIIPNNTFWGSTQNGSKSIDANSMQWNASFEGMDFEMKNGTSTNSYINDFQTRVYNGYSLKISVPDGYVITKIVFTSGDTWDGSLSADYGTIQSDDKTWVGESSSTTISFAKKNFIDKINITVYKAGEVPAKTLESISWKNFTTSYNVNDTFKADGVVTAIYSDGTTADVSNDAIFSTPDMSSEGPQTVTVTYQDKITTGVINVTAASTGGDETITMSSYFTQNTNLETGKTYTWGSLSCTFTKINSAGSNYNAKDGGIRFYENDILAVSSEKTIKKLAFEFYGSKKGPFTADSGTVETTDTHVVWTGSSKSVTLKASAQIRFKSITVTY